MSFLSHTSKFMTSCLSKNTLNNIIPTSTAAITSIFSTQQQKQQQVRFRSNRSRRGLYDGKDVRFGNRVSFSEKKTRRKFKPNVFIKRVYSETLDKMVRFHLTASTLRSIDRMGGLDNYLLKSKHIKDDVGEGGRAKRRILEKLEKRKLYEQRVAEEEAAAAAASIAATESS